MKISTKVEYGLIALTDIAMNSEQGTAVSASEIAQRQHISQKYLEQILMLLKQAGFVRAQKGLKGGYSLAKPTASVKLSEVLNALDNSILADTYTPEDAQNEGLRPTVNACLWGRINLYLRELTTNITLETFLEQCRESAEQSWDYYNI